MAADKMAVRDVSTLPVRLAATLIFLLATSFIAMVLYSQGWGWGSEWPRLAIISGFGLAWWGGIALVLSVVGYRPWRRDPRVRAWAVVVLLLNVLPLATLLAVGLLLGF